MSFISAAASLTPAPKAPLTEKAMLVRLTIRQWQASKHDRTISQEVARNHGSDVEMGRFQKDLLEKGALKRIQSAVTALRNHHYENTLPWLDEGRRVLPATKTVVFEGKEVNGFVAYVERQRQLKDEFEAAVAEFIGKYEAFVDNARVRLNGLFNPADYPPASRLRRKFAVELDFDKIPEANDFRLAIGAEEQARIRADIEGRAERAIAIATADLWKRIHTVVSDTVKRLRDFEMDPETGKVTHNFRDSLVAKMRDFVELLGRLNIGDDPVLEEMRQRLADALCTSEPQALRDDPEKRAEAIRSAESILADMAGYVDDDDDE